jgi:nicotinamidase-related amidase
MTNACLIMIDWQLGFRDPNYWGPRNNPEAEKNAEKLLVYWRAKGWPVIHIRHASTEAKSVLRRGRPGFEFEPFARPQGQEPIYEKHVNSAFIGTSLEADLKARGLFDLVFTGITSDHCVSTSVRMAANLGFRPRIVTDATYTFAQRLPDGTAISAETIHQAHLASLYGEFAQVVMTRELLGAGHPQS